MELREGGGKDSNSGDDGENGSISPAIILLCTVRIRPCIQPREKEIRKRLAVLEA